ncbi:MAG: NAD(P)-binding domain-containing protein [Phycisphaerales bacterium]|nr:NAD(P)-binding domain-containing protein [Phycisphaerales bacterium]
MPAKHILIIGAGPIGLETAATLQEAGLSVTCVDEGPIGGTIYSLFPPMTRFFSSPERLAIAGIDLQVAAQEKATREEYLAYLRSVVQTRALPVKTYEKVTEANHDGRSWHVTTRGRGGQLSIHEASHVVLAFGGTHQSRRLGIPGEDLPHVDRHLGDPHRFFGRKVTIVGGKNSAAEAALRCWRVGAEVTIIHRGDGLHERVKYWIRPELQSLIDEGRVKACFNSTVTSIEPDSIQVKTNGLEQTIECQDVLVMIGYQQDPTLLKMFGVDYEGPQSAPVHDPVTMQTNSNAVYVAGTAIAGTQQRFRTYIENCHVHGGRIAAAILGNPPPPEVPARVLPES